MSSLFGLGSAAALWTSAWAASPIAAATGATVTAETAMLVGGGAACMGAGAAAGAGLMYVHEERKSTNGKVGQRMRRQLQNKNANMR